MTIEIFSIFHVIVGVFMMLNDISKAQMMIGTDKAGLVKWLDFLKICPSKNLIKWLDTRLVKC